MKTDSLKERRYLSDILSGFSQTFITRGFGAVLELVFNLIIARTLGANGAGSFFVVLSAVTLGSMIGRVGLDNALLRFISVNSSQKNFSALKGVHRKGITLAVICSSIVTAVVFILAPNLAQYFDIDPKLFRYISLAIPVVSLIFLYSESLKGIRKVLLSQVVHGVLLYSILISLVLLSLIFRIPITTESFVLYYIISAISTLLIAIYFWFSNTGQLRNIKGEFNTADLLRSSLPLLLVQPMSRMISIFPTILLGIWATKDSVGIFNATYKVTLAISLILISSNSILAPIFAELFAKNETGMIQRITRRATTFMLAFSAPIILVMFLLPEKVMSIFGQEYITQGSLMLQILAIGQIVNVITGPVNYLLMMSGNEDLVRNNVLICSLIGIVLNLILINLYDLLGAIISTAITLSLINVRAAIIVKRRLDIVVLPGIKRVL